MINANIDCSKCPKQGVCCTEFKMQREIVEKNKNKFQVKSINMVYTDDGGCRVFTGDRLCVFLNRSTKMCSIYEDRPEVCRLYGSGIHELLTCFFFDNKGDRLSKEKEKEVFNKAKNFKRPVK